MSAVLKLERLDSGGGVVETYSFNEQEVPVADVNPFQRSGFGYNAENNAYPFINGDPWHIIPVAFRIHDDTTIAKLNDIADEITAGSIFRLYPALTDLPGLSFKVVFNPAELPRELFVVGKFRGNETVDIAFLECESSDLIGMEDDIGVD